MDKEQYIKEHFPDVDPGAKPCGPQIMIQLRTVKKQSTGGIILATETREYNAGNTQVARVVKVGQIAFRDRNSGEEWKEGSWAEVGDVILAPRYGGHRFEVPIPGTDDEAIFAIINDTDVKMVIEGNFAAFDKIL